MVLTLLTNNVPCNRKTISHPAYAPANVTSFVFMRIDRLSLSCPGRTRHEAADKNSSPLFLVHFSSLRSGGFFMQAWEAACVQLRRHLNQLQHIDFALNTSLPNGNDLDNLASNKIVRSRTRRFTSFSGGRRDLPVRHPALETGIMTSQRLPHAHPYVNSVYMGRENAASSARIRGKDRPL